MKKSPATGQGWGGRDMNNEKIKEIEDFSKRNVVKLWL